VSSLPRLTKAGLTRRTVLASGLLALLIGGAFAVLLVATLDQRHAQKLSGHSRTELVDAEGLLKLVVDLETGVRGFVITREERFLEPWNYARVAFPRQAQALADFVDDPVQARRVRQMRQDGLSYIRDYSVPVVNAVRRNDPVARSVATTEEGKRRVDVLRADFDRFVNNERASVIARQHDVDVATQRAVVTAAGGLGLSIILIALSGGYLVRAVVLPVRRAADMAGRLAGGDLAVRMPETGTMEIGRLERAFNTMGSSLEANQSELRQLAEEQVALRRVATLVARGVPPSEVWGAVVAEVDQLLNADVTGLLRYDPGSTATLLATRSRSRLESPVGTRYTLEDEGIPATVLRTGRAAHRESADGDPASRLGVVGTLAIRSEVGAPIAVEGRVWGVIIAAWTEQRASAGSEGRIAEFTELVATAIANADSRAELTASRARVVATGDETRRRIERDLHDGAQQRLVHTIVSLKLARQALADDGGPYAELLDEALAHAELANGELRELVHGILPGAIAHGGLRAGVAALVSRAPIPVSTDVTGERLPPGLESTAYFIIAEALTNVVKHSGSGSAHISAAVRGDTLHLEVRDDGIGGAELGEGSGLLGLQDRAAAVNGELRVESPAGGGTVISAALPIPSS
jgi:signal transduction histidine kinase